MTSDRPYRDAMPSQVARMRLGSGGREPVRHVCQSRRSKRFSRPHQNSTNQAQSLDVLDLVQEDKRSRLRRAPTSDAAPGERRCGSGLIQLPPTGHCLCSGLCSELLKDVANVDFRRCLTDKQRAGDLFVREALRNEFVYLHFPGRKLGPGASSSAGGPVVPNSSRAERHPPAPSRLQVRFLGLRGLQVHGRSQGRSGRRAPGC